MNRETIAALPKIELHLHLDCSLSHELVRSFQPGISEGEYRQNFIAPAKMESLGDCLLCASNGIALLQTEDALRKVVEDLFIQLQKDNIIYAEIRFAPLLHLEKGLAPEAVVETVADSVAERVRATGIQAGVILCTLRHFNEAQSLQTVHLVDKYINQTPVAGFDLASDEGAFPIDCHVKAFEHAIRKGIPRTAHAGEARGPESIWETLQHFQPHRLGHGVRSVEDERLMQHLIENDIHLEINPTSNIVTDVFKEYRDHSINRLYQASVSVGVNTDGRSLINVSLTDEYMKLTEAFDWGVKHFYTCNRNALEHAFTTPDVKEKLGKVLDSGYGPHIA